MHGEPCSHIMKNLSNKDLKCKNHVDVLEGFDDPNDNRSRQKWFIKFPYLLFHQFVCVDNPILAKTSELIYEKYGYNKDWYKESIKQVEQKTIQIKQTIIEKLI